MLVDTVPQALPWCYILSPLRGWLVPGQWTRMTAMKYRIPLSGLLVALLLAALLYGQKKPQIHVPASHVKSGDSFIETGIGFTPNRTAISHLLKPDGSEYNTLRFRIDEHGDFSHKIDTVMLDNGTFELWAEDEASKTVSNRIQFTVQ